MHGIRQFVAENEPWSIFLELRALDSHVPEWLPDWRGDGILARTGTPALADAVRHSGVPWVELRASCPYPNVPFVGTDNRVVARLAADHLLDRGFRSFGFYGISTEVYFVQRRVHFIEFIREAGYPCAVLEATTGREHPNKWEVQQEQLSAWIAALPKPAGILACTDQLGFWLLDACRRAGVNVPEEVAVVGVENEEILCTTAMPTLSSVQMNGESVGYQAAALLAGMMSGKANPAAETLIEPVGLVTRGSSDVIAVADRDLAAAMKHSA
ncbi:MAG: XylR family transcriptional regulator [Planctomycetes bacterium]|nr:XylR family transcriptional regulator [Planctomycetota bacterium]